MSKPFEDILNDYGLIESKPDILDGTPVMYGTRVLAETILDAHTAAVNEIIDSQMREFALNTVQFLKDHATATDGDILFVKCSLADLDRLAQLKEQTK